MFNHCGVAVKRMFLAGILVPVSISGAPAAESPSQPVDASGAVRVLTEHSRAVNGLSFSRDSRQLVSASADGTVGVFDVRSGKLRKKISVGNPQLFSPVFSKDGKKIVAGVSGHIRQWDAVTGQLVFDSPAGQLVAVTPTDRFIAGASPQPVITILQFSTGKILNSFRAHAGKINALGFSPSGDWLASAGDDGAKMWEVDTGRQLFVMMAHQSPVTGICFTGDGKHVVTGGADGTVLLWEAQSGRLVGKYDYGTPVLAIAVDPTGQRIAATGYDAQIKVWKIGDEKKPLRSLAPQMKVSSLAFSSDGKLLAAGGTESVIRIWDVSSGPAGVVPAPPVAMSPLTVSVIPPQPPVVKAGEEKSIEIRLSNPNRQAARDVVVAVEIAPGDVPLQITVLPMPPVGTLEPGQTHRVQARLRAGDGLVGGAFLVNVSVRSNNCPESGIPSIPFSAQPN